MRLFQFRPRICICMSVCFFIIVKAYMLLFPYCTSLESHMYELDKEFPMLVRGCCGYLLSPSRVVYSDCTFVSQSPRPE